MTDIALSYLVFPSGPEVPSLSALQVHGTLSSILAPPQIPPLPAAPSYVFGFWVIDGVLSTNPIASFPDTGTSYTAIAWYFTPEGLPQPLLTTWLFSLDDNAVVAGKTPIGSVTPPGAWNGTSTTVPTNAGELTVTAKNLVLGAGGFSSWMVLEPSQVTGAMFTVPANADMQAIAFYSLALDPCQAIRTELADIAPGDFRTPAEFFTAERALQAKLRACESAHHEVP